MIVTIDSTTQPVELYHLSILFQSLAKAHGFVVPVASTSVGELTVDQIDTTDATSAVEALADLIDRTGVKVEDVPPVTYSVETTPINTDHASIDDTGTVTISVAPPVATTDANLDADGLPWDARIHSGSRERNANGKWRTARKPKALNEDEWQATMTRVNAELRDLMDIPVSTGAVADAAAEEALTDAEIDEFVAVEPVVVAPPVTIAPPVVVPPVTAVAPPISDKPAIETFAQLMSWLTSRTPKDEAAKPAMVTRVNEILAANGLTTLQQLGQRADLIPQVLAQFRDAFGE